MSICNVTKLPCAYCNPVCSSRIKKESCAGCIHWCVRLYDSKMCCYNPDSEYYYDVYNGGCKLHSNRKDDYMEENKQKEVMRYECAYCGVKFDSPTERANCELDCYKKRVEAGEKARKEKLAKEKEERKKKIIQSRKELATLEQMYHDDYREHVYSLREPVIRTVDFNGDWGKFFEDCFDRVGY